MHNSHLEVKSMDDLTQQTAVHRQATRAPLSPVIGATGFVALLGLGLAYTAYMRRYILHDLPLTGALNGRIRTFMSSAGELAYYESLNVHHHGPLATPSTVPALVFIHDAGLASSSYEMRPLYEHYAHERSVYALDLPGYGFSHRAERAYTPGLYRDAILDFLTLELHGGPVDAVALSLGAEFLALAAEQHAELFRTLTFISPTGLSSQPARPRRHDTLYQLLSNPYWSRLIYDTLTSRYGLGYMMGKKQQRQPDYRLVHYAYITSHQPRAQIAPLQSLAGRLSSPDIFSVYQALALPILTVYGRSHRTHFDRVDHLHAKPNWRIAEFKQCGEYVHFDDPRGVIAQMDRLLQAA
jgi:pimeloyl-ACP methyl ester carboxylesterase